MRRQFRQQRYISKYPRTPYNGNCGLGINRADDPKKLPEKNVKNPAILDNFLFNYN